MKRLKYLAAVLTVAGILMQPEAAVQGAQRAMRMWADNVAPSLFPFLVLMPVLTSREACTIYEALFSGIMRRIFGLPGAAAPAVIIGMISGSPGGAIAVHRIAAQTGMKSSQACRIALSMGGASPAFLVLGVGYGLLGSAEAGMRLALIQMVIQLLLLKLLQHGCDDIPGTVSSKIEDKIGRPVRMAVENILVVCGYMVFFSSVSGVAAAYVGKKVGALLLLLADMPSGLAGILESGLPYGRFLMCMAIGFTGLCICTQNLDVLRQIGMPSGRYFAVRCIAAALMGSAAPVIWHCSTDIAEESLKNVESTYAFSSLSALIMMIPVLIYFSNNLFLNKRKLNQNDG